MTEISQRELRNDSGSIVSALVQGRSFVLTRHGVPVGELRPLRRARFVDAVAVTEIFRNAPPIAADQFWQDLDDSADQDITPRG
ncbi:MAG: type II toxin-antitoxin system Phd/YefM family antitoxin [Actinomycetales bacterium]